MRKMKRTLYFRRSNYGLFSLRRSGKKERNNVSHPVKIYKMSNYKRDRTHNDIASVHDFMNRVNRTCPARVRNSSSPFINVLYVVQFSNSFIDLIFKVRAELK